MIFATSAKSERGEQSFQLCDFKDDPPPLFDRVRSKDLKLLIRKSHCVFEVYLTNSFCFDDVMMLYTKHLNYNANYKAKIKG